MKCILLLTFVAFCHSYSYYPLSGSIYGTIGQGIGYGSYGNYIPQVLSEIPVSYPSTGFSGPYATSYSKPYGGSLYPWGIYNVLAASGKQNVYSPLTQFESSVPQSVPTLAAVLQAEGQIFPQEQLQQQMQNYPLLQYLLNLNPTQTPLPSNVLQQLSGGYPVYSQRPISGYGYGQPIIPAMQAYGGIPVPVAV